MVSLWKNQNDFKVKYDVHIYELTDIKSLKDFIETSTDVTVTKY